MPHRPLSVLSHVELLTPSSTRPSRSRATSLGLDVVAEEGDSVYLRCWGDYYAHSLVLTDGAEPGLGHARLADVERRAARRVAVASVEAAGIAGRVDRVLVRPRPGVPLRRARRPPDRAVLGGRSRGRARRRGVAVPRAPAAHGRRTASRVRLLDHVTVTTPDVKATMRLVPRRARLPRRWPPSRRRPARRGSSASPRQREVPRPRVHPGLRRHAGPACTTSRSGSRPTTT